MLWNFENNLLPTLNIFLSSRFPYHLTESRLFNRLRNIDWSNTQKNILWTDVLNCQHFMWKIHQGFSSRFSSHFQMAQRIFPSLSERFRYRNSFTFLLSFKYCEIYLHFMDQKTRPLSIKKRTLPSNHITIERLWWLALESLLELDGAASRKLVYGKRFCKYCSRFCFRIPRISSRFLIELSSI